MTQLPLPDPNGQLLEPDRTPLLEWLRDQTKCDIFCDFETTGSRHFFGTGNDTDFLVDITKIPAELQHLIPPPRFGDTPSDYGGCVSIFCDEAHPAHGKVDFLIASPERTKEFEYATEHFCSMRRDPLVPPDVWKLLQDNKPLRVAVFRALRHSFPDSTLNH